MWLRFCAPVSLSVSLSACLCVGGWVGAIGTKENAIINKIIKIILLFIISDPLPGLIWHWRVQNAAGQEIWDIIQNCENK